MSANTCWSLSQQPLVSIQPETNNNGGPIRPRCWSVVLVGKRGQQPSWTLGESHIQGGATWD